MGTMLGQQLLVLKGKEVSHSLGLAYETNNQLLPDKLFQVCFGTKVFHWLICLKHKYLYKVTG